jgi:hypothetical protein
MLQNETNDPLTNFKRIEEKFRLTPQEGMALYEEIATKTTVDEFIPGQSISTITTLYCDGVGLPFFRTAKAGGVRTRIRIRLYGEPQDNSDAFGWIEWKRSPPRGEMGYTTKRRFRVPREHLPSFFTKSFTDDDIRSFQKHKKNAEEAIECYHNLVDLMEQYSISPLVASHYHRRALILNDGPERATFDFDLGYSLVSWDDGALRLTNTINDSAVIVELKYSSPLAGWLRALALCFQPSVGFSKFERALELCWLSNHSRDK